MKELVLPDNWWDLKHRNENLLAHFSDKELETELSRRRDERRKLEMIKIVNGREAVAYFVNYGGDESKEFEQWELHVCFSDGTKHRFDFSSKVGQTEETMDQFRELYFPTLPRFNQEDYERLKRAKKKICQTS